MSSFVDSNVFIYAFTNHEYTHISRKIIDKESEIIINPLVLVETYAGLLKITKNKDFSVRVITGILNKENMEIVDFDMSLLFESLKRLKKHHLSFSDVIHYTTALLNNCSKIISYDKDFDAHDLEIKRIDPKT